MVTGKTRDTSGMPASKKSRKAQEYGTDQEYGIPVFWKSSIAENDSRLELVSTITGKKALKIFFRNA